MKELTLAEIKGVEVGILHYFAAFCQQNDISFFLSNGTLLGAVKYGGFIPWDDDVDVLVPREDYEKLLRLFQDNGQYALCCRQRCPAYRYPFAKLCDVTTQLDETNVDNGTVLGINMDIFPLDSWAPNRKKAMRQAKANKLRTKCLGYSKTIRFIPGEGRTGFGKWLRTAVHPLFQKFGPDLFCKRMDREAKRHWKQIPSPYLGSIAWPAYGTREVLDAQLFSSAVPVTFEGSQYPAPAGYEAYLTSLYGNYRQDPPIEKQVTHHNFVAYRK